MKKKLNLYKGPILLLITAFIWGTTFVAQSQASEYVKTFTFNTARFLTSGIVLLIVYLSTRNKSFNKPSIQPTNNKLIILYSIFVGIALAIASNLQQFGIELTKSPAKSGFITSIYIVFVPILGLFFKKKVSPIIIVCLAISLIGSYLISSIGTFTFELGDIITLLCALFFAVQIVIIDFITNNISCIKLSCIQFLVAGVLSLILMLIKEPVDFELFKKAIPAILYSALFSGCIAFTLQIVGQKYTDPTIASLVMSLESIFALLSGLVILHETLTGKQLLGCFLIFVAVISSQTFHFKKKTK